MSNALTYWAIRAGHLLSHIVEYWLWRYIWLSNPHHQLFTRFNKKELYMYIYIVPFCQNFYQTNQSKGIDFESTLLSLLAQKWHILHFCYIIFSFITKLKNASLITKANILSVYQKQEKKYDYLCLSKRILCRSTCYLNVYTKPPQFQLSQIAEKFNRIIFLVPS